MFGGLELKTPNEQQQKNTQENEDQSTGNVSSAFSFLSNQTTSTPSLSTTAPPPPAPELTKTDEKREDTTPSTPTLSGFSFLSTTTVPIGTVPDATQAPIVTSSSLAVDSRSGSDGAGSGFSFLAQQEQVTPHTSPPKPSQDLLSLSSMPVPSTAGITFSSASSKPIKKKSRSKKIGTMSSNPPVSVPSYGVAVSDDTIQSSTSREEAEEAARKAEEFLQEKMKQEMKNPISPTLALAEAAAEEAKAMNNTTGKDKNRMPGFGGGSISKFFQKSSAKLFFTDSKQPSSSDTPPPPPLVTPTENNASPGKEEGESPRSEEQPSSLRNVHDDHEVTANAAILEKEETSNDQNEQEDVYEREAKRAAEEEIQRLNKLKQEEEEERLLKQEEERKRLEDDERRILEEKQKKKPEETFQQIIQDFNSKVKENARALNELRIQKGKLVQERVLAEKGQLLAAQQITQAESRQTVAAEEEDYDLADRLAEVIQKHISEKEEHVKILSNIDVALSNFDEQRESIKNDIQECFKAILRNLKSFHLEQESSEKEGRQEALLKFEATSKRLSTENERLNNELKHIERDEKIVDEEKEELECIIDEQCKHIVEEKNELSQQLDSVAREVESLRAQLAIKEKEASKLQDQLSTHEASIEKIRSKFSRQLTRITKKETTVIENRNEWEAEKDALQKLKDTHDKEVENHSEKLLNFEKMIEKVKNECDNAKKLETVIGNVMENNMKHDGENDIECVRLLQTEVVKCEADVEEANQKLSSAEAGIERLKKEIQDIDDKIPTLEKAKKDAAKKRDFKTAGKASKEIKEVTRRRDMCHEELESEAMERLSMAKEESTRMKKELDAKKKLLNDKEEDQAIRSMTSLAKRIKTLKDTKKTLCGDVMGVDEDYQTCVASVGVSILNGEIESLITEGESLGAKYGQWDDIYKSHLVDDENKTIEEDTAAEIAPQDQDSSNDTCRLNGDDVVQVDGDEGQVSDEKIANGDVESNNEKERGEGIPAEDNQEESSTSSNDIDERIQQWKQLTERLKTLEAAIDEAVEVEDYDRAGEIDDEIKEIKMKIDTLKIPEDVIDAIKNDDGGDVLPE